MIGAKIMSNHVICVKWGNKYPSQYVNVLKNMCQRHITVPFEFHCLTEDPKGLDPDIQIIKLPTHPGIKTWWSKLYMFSPELPVQGTILYFDLDIIVFRNIDRLFSHCAGEFQIIRDFNRCRVKDWKLSNSSVMRWETGRLDYLWTEFANNPSQIISHNHGDQDWISKRAAQDIRHWPDEWIRSYKWEMQGRKEIKVTKGNKKVFEHPPTIADENCVAVFHGLPNPHECGDPFVVDNWR
jgi:hypothetical protein